MDTCSNDPQKYMAENFWDYPQLSSMYLVLRAEAQHPSGTFVKMNVASNTFQCSGPKCSIAANLIYSTKDSGNKNPFAAGLHYSFYVYAARDDPLMPEFQIRGAVLKAS